MKKAGGIVFLIAMFAAPCAHAQDTRTVTEPGIPPICTTLSAKLTAQKDSIAEADENKTDTQRIQEAIEHCRAGTAVELRAADGNNAFLSGPLKLKAGITLLIAANTTLYASRNPRDYDISPGTCGKVDHDGHGCKPLILMLRAPDAAVMGDGAIDGRGGAKLTGEKVTWWDLAQEAKVKNLGQNDPRIIVAEESDNFTLYRITLRNSPNFHVIVSRTNGFTAWGVKVNSPKTARNTDCIDPSSSSNISIVYSYLHCGDDNVAIKAGRNGSSNHITVAHDHFYTGHGMSIGSETNGGVSDIDVRDLTIDGADNGIRIKSNSTKGGLVHNVTYSDVCIRDVKEPIIMDPFYSTERGTLIPTFEDIALHNVTILTSGKVTLLGTDKAHLLKITLDGVRIDIGGLRPENIRAAYARITSGPRQINFPIQGEDVEVQRVEGPQSNMSCRDKFVPFPE